MPPRRETAIAHSVQYSLTHNDRKPTLLGSVPGYFHVYWLTFECVREDLFKALRGTWQMEQNEYLKSFTGKKALVPMGDMGYSGSTFFMSSDSRYLVKSVPRSFEHSFLRDDLLLPYAEYMQQNPFSLLVRITDFIQCTQYSIGSLLGLAPSHHVVMENIKYGQEAAEAEGGKWESWDLKPMSYFYPERDVAGGALSSEATKSKLAEEFNDKLSLTLDQAEDMKAQLSKDTKLLSSCNAVDYSLFLVRIPKRADDGSKSPAKPSVSPATLSSWRTGVPSADGKYIYRAALLDFFWAKHKVHARAMTGVINTYNAVDPQGPMSITAEPVEYRERFLKMCVEIVDVQEGSQ